MDVQRYLRNMQDRVANGVRDALAEAGCSTGEFVSKVTNISNNTVHAHKVEGSTFVVGDHGSASSTRTTNSTNSTA